MNKQQTYINFLKETEQFIEKLKLTPDDIIFIGSQESGHSCTWDEFKILADKEYLSTPDKQVAAVDLRIIFRDGLYMYRYQEAYEPEKWGTKRFFTIPDNRRKIKRLFTEEDETGYRRLAELNLT